MRIPNVEFLKKENYLHTLNLRDARKYMNIKYCIMASV